MRSRHLVDRDRRRVARDLASWQIKVNTIACVASLLSRVCPR